MIRRHVNLVRWWITFGYFFVPTLAFVLAWIVRFESGFFEAADADPYAYVGLLLVCTLFWALVVEHFGLNLSETIFALHTGVRTVAKAAAYTMALLLTFTFFYRGVAFSRVFIVVACAFLFVLALAVLHLFSYLIRARRSNGNGVMRIAVLGVDDYAKRVADRLRANPLFTCEIAAFVGLPGQQPLAGLGPLVVWEDLDQIVDVLHCREVIVALPPERLSSLKDLAARLQMLCIPVRVVLDLGEDIFVPERVFDFWGIPLLDLRPYPVDTIRYTITKRGFDVVFSAAALLVLCPLFGLIAALIKMTSAGPVFFAQERVGLNGKRFMMLKFRTMYLQDAATSNSLHTARGDKRITRIGQFLRRTSIDELPQFWNVLRGDMSVVGPRPELTFFVEKFRGEIPSYMARHNVKCGITGWAQVNGLRGSDSSIPERIEYDLYYLRNWSLLFDVKIIGMTFLAGLVSKNAY
ncbi:MAG: undecaprenyl-phosphate glucose phosphotransferase [Acidobacteria bacterium]|nr:undecaprenyl-phosphate glucose phosphotransferase [Acidobacteriota bacterium]